MRVFKYVVIALTIFALTGCESTPSTKDIVNISTDAVNVAIRYQDSEPLEVITTVPLTEEEQDSVIDALIQIEESRDVLKAYLKTPELVIQDKERLYEEYTKLRNSYLVIRFVVIKHFSEYSKADQSAMSSFDTLAVNLDRSFVQLYEKYEGSGTAQTLMALADVGIRIAALM